MKNREVIIVLPGMDRGASLPLDKRFTAGAFVDWQARQTDWPVDVQGSDRHQFTLYVRGKNWHFKKQTPKRNTPVRTPHEFLVTIVEGALVCCRECILPRLVCACRQLFDALKTLIISSAKNTLAWLGAIHYRVGMSHVTPHNDVIRITSRHRVAATCFDHPVRPESEYESE